MNKSRCLKLSFVPILLIYLLGSNAKRAEAAAPLVAIACAGGGCQAAATALGGVILSGHILINREAFKNSIGKIRNFFTGNSDDTSNLYKFEIVGNIYYPLNSSGMVISDQTSDFVESEIFMKAVIFGTPKSYKECMSELNSFLNVAGWGYKIKHAMTEHPTVTVIVKDLPEGVPVGEGILQNSAEGKCVEL